MGNQPSERDIKKFEDQYKIKLPADFREFTMSPLGGLFMDVREEIWPQAKAFEVGPFWSFCRGIIVYGIAKGIPDFLDIRVRTKKLGSLTLNHLKISRKARNGFIFCQILIFILHVTYKYCIMYLRWHK